jgi:hypothetical protein
MKKLTLKHLLAVAKKFDENLTIILPTRLSLDRFCILVTEEELNPQVIHLTLSLDVFNDILENLRLQKPDYTNDEALEAIIFYINHDAFIELKKENNSNCPI